MNSPICQPAAWDPASGGRELQFCATDADIKRWLAEFLLPEFAPYFVVGMDLIRQNRKTYVERGFFHPISDVPSHGEDGNLRWSYWICSQVITPDWRNLLSSRSIEVACSLSGLVDLQHPLPLKDKIDTSRIAITDRIVNNETGEIRVHDQYLKIFNALKREIQKQLVYTAVYSFPSGATNETSRGMITAEAAQAYNEGKLPLAVAPGRYVGKQRKEE